MPAQCKCQGSLYGVDTTHIIQGIHPDIKPRNDPPSEVGQFQLGKSTGLIGPYGTKGIPKQARGARLGIPRSTLIESGARRLPGTIELFVPLGRIESWGNP